MNDWNESGVQKNVRIERAIAKRRKKGKK